MDFSAQFDDLQRRVGEAKEAAQDASESRDLLKQRIDQAQDDLDQVVRRIEQQTNQTGADAPSKWAQMKADVAARRDDVKTKIHKRTRVLDAKDAANEARWAEDDALDALDYAAWTVDNARLAVLDAIDARAYADDRAKLASSQ